LHAYLADNSLSSQLQLPWLIPYLWDVFFIIYHPLPKTTLESTSESPQIKVFLRKPHESTRAKKLSENRSLRPSVKFPMENYGVVKLP
jgi:hypothetical protein